MAFMMKNGLQIRVFANNLHYVFIKGCSLEQLSKASIYFSWFLQFFTLRYNTLFSNFCTKLLSCANLATNAFFDQCWAKTKKECTFPQNTKDRTFWNKIAITFKLSFTFFYFFSFYKKNIPEKLTKTGSHGFVNFLLSQFLSQPSYFVAKSRKLRNPEN